MIVASRKIASGTNETFVFHRIHGLHYRLADPVSLNQRIGQRFGQPQDVASLFLKSDYVEFITFQRWLDSGRHALLACAYSYHNSGIVYFVTWDTHTGKLSDYHRVNERDVSLQYVR